MLTGKTQMMYGWHFVGLIAWLALGALAPAVMAKDLANNFDLVESPLSMALSQYATQSIHSYAIVTQDGIENLAIINQAAQNSLASIEQYGVRNVAEIQQFGYDNTADIKQFGADNKANVVQDGIGNTATITQYGQQQFSVQQLGHNESIQITQY